MTEPSLTIGIEEDIIDAYVLALRVKQAAGAKPIEGLALTAALPGTWDRNGDGAITRADADAIALSVVALSK